MARRLTFEGNPQPSAAWPSYPLCCRREDGSEERLPLAFTFADFALLEPSFRSHFAVVPDGCPETTIIPLADYLELEDDDAAVPLPFVWECGPTDSCAVSW